MKPYYQRAGWRWLRGMSTEPFRDETGEVVHPSWLVKYEGNRGPYANPANNDAAPDLDDPATQGAALAVLREVTGEPGLSFARAGLAGDATGGRWYMIASRRLADATMAIDAATEAEALHAALDRLIPE